ncbi:MAG: DUF5020 family protein [Balneolaceae bacterium]|nr:DUF5020 family protein [Balneolaceae bacterium]
MKYIPLLFVLSIFSFEISTAQNLQTHFDLGEDRQMVTATFEMFKVDELGNTFYFIDFNFGGAKANVEGVSSAYYEIARSFLFWDNPFALHVELNSGMFRNDTFSAPINQAYLAGSSYTFIAQDFSKTFKVALLYKYIQNKTNASFQLNTVWQIKLANDALIFKGFTDFWKEENLVFDDQSNSYTTDFVFLSEPQLWYVLTPKFQLGSEVEISANFAANKGLMINPTLGIKWIF